MKTKNQLSKSTLSVLWLVLFSSVSSCTQFGLEKEEKSISNLLMEAGMYFALTPGNSSCELTSKYVTMEDGVPIAITVALPKNRSKEEKLPAIVSFTPYWRDMEMNADLLAQAGAVVDMVFRGLTKDCGGSSSIDPALLLAHGYAHVMVDVRGTGASYGNWTGVYTDRETADFSQVIDAIVAEEWSNGSVAVTGTSYGGTTALMAASGGNPAVKAVIPMFYFWDTYAQQNFVGGIVNDYTIRVWSKMRVLDTGTLPCIEEWTEVGNDCSMFSYIKGPMPVDSDTDRSLMQQAFKVHEEGNITPTQLLGFAESSNYKLARDTINTNFPASKTEAGPFLKIAELNTASVPAFFIGGWFDGATSESVIDSMMNLTGAKTAYIGPWNHGANYVLDPLKSDSARSPNAEELEVVKAFFAFLDHYVKGDATASLEEGIHYYELGSGEWQTTATWPPAGWSEVDYFMGAANTLASSAPVSAAGEDSYTLNLEAGSGLFNRWHTQVNGQGKVEYTDRNIEDENLLTYTTDPLASDLRIHGNVQVDLYAKSDSPDWNCFVYLETVDSAGAVHYITEGQLRAIHRKVSLATPPYTLTALRPYHSYLEADWSDVPAGAVEKYSLSLIPTAVKIPAGHRLRISIAGADADTFVRVPAAGNPTIILERNAIYPSVIRFPIVP